MTSNGSSLKEALALLSGQRQHDLRTEGDIWREMGDSFHSQSDESLAQDDLAAARQSSLDAQSHWREACGVIRQR